MSQDVTVADLLNIQQVATQVGLAQGTIRNRERDGTFPAATLYKGRMHWHRETIAAWCRKVMPRATRPDAADFFAGATRRRKHCRRPG